MNLQLYKAVLGRFRWLVLAGILLGVALALLSYVRVSLDGGVSLTYRQQESWESSATLLLTDGDFQLGRDPRSADPYRFIGLTTIYARVASSGEVRRMMRGAPVPGGSFFAVSDVSAGEVLLPTITAYGRAPSAAAAVKTVRRGTEAFIRYLRRSPGAASIPSSQRVRLAVLIAPSKPKLLVPRKKTLAFVVFLAVLTATIGLAFVLENVRPSAPGVRVAAQDPADVLPEPGVRIVAEDPADVLREPGVRVVAEESASTPPEPQVEPEEAQGVAARRWA